jgi:hypothetical protein
MALSSFALTRDLEQALSNRFRVDECGCFQHLPLHSRQPKNPGYDQVKGHDIIQQSWNQQNKDSGNQGDQRLQGNVKLH